MTEDTAAQNRPPTVYLHIGTPKSGTTFLQGVLGHNRQRLAEQGVLWPGSAWVDQVHAVRDLANITPADHQRGETAGAWQRLVDEIHAWDGPSAIVSMEWLVDAKPRQIRRAIDSLAPAAVHVVLTGRDLARNVPASWQEDMRNWFTYTWEEYLAAVTDPESATLEVGTRFWRQQDLGAILRRWGKMIPAERMHVLTVPPPGTDPRLLWQRFADIAGIDAADYDVPSQGRNASLGVVSAELMRRVNTVARERGLRWKPSERLLKQVLGKRVLTRRSDREPSLALPAYLYPWAIDQGKRIADDVVHAGVHVSGDLAELIPDPATARETTTPDAISDRELLEAAIDGIVGMVGAVNRMQQTGALTTSGDEPAPKWRSAPTDRMKELLAEGSQRVARNDVLRRAWHTARRTTMLARRRISRGRPLR